MTNLPNLLKNEIEQNLEALKADLDFLSNADERKHPFTEAYQDKQYQSFLTSGKPPELLGAFYRSLEILRDGHAGLMSADSESIEKAYRTIIESAIAFGEQLLDPER